MIAIQNLNTPLANVALATLSRLTADPERYRRVYLSAVGRLALVIAPLGGLLVGGAEPIVRLLLGEQWTEAAPIMAWMSVAMVYLPITYAMSWLFMSQDRMPEMLRVGMINAALTLVAVIIGLPFGPLGVAIAFVASGAVVRAPLLFWMAGRRGPVRTGDLYPALALPALGGLAVALIVTALRRWTAADALPLPLEVAVLGALAFVSTLAVYALFPAGRRALADIRKIPALVTP
jgi:PST family polysaccharide transporter